jgi:hypothetical protein
MNMRIAHLEALPAYQLKEALQRCLYTFTTNANELATHISEFLTSHHIAREVPADYVNELVRRVHNYLTSVTSLVDSQRVVMRHIVARFGTNPDVDEVDAHVRSVRQTALDRLARQHRLPVLG